MLLPLDLSQQNSKFLFSFLVLEEEGGCSVVAAREMTLLLLLPLLGVLDFLTWDFPFSSG